MPIIRRVGHIRTPILIPIPHRQRIHRLPHHQRLLLKPRPLQHRIPPIPIRPLLRHRLLRPRLPLHQKLNPRPVEIQQRQIRPPIPIKIRHPRRPRIPVQLQHLRRPKPNPRPLRRLTQPQTPPSHEKNSTPAKSEQRRHCPPLANFHPTASPEPPSAINLPSAPSLIPLLPPTQNRQVNPELKNNPESASEANRLSPPTVSTSISRLTM